MIWSMLREHFCNHSTNSSIIVRNLVIIKTKRIKLKICLIHQITIQTFPIVTFPTRSKQRVIFKTKKKITNQIFFELQAVVRGLNSTNSKIIWPLLPNYRKDTEPLLTIYQGVHITYFIMFKRQFYSGFVPTDIY